MNVTLFQPKTDSQFDVFWSGCLKKADKAMAKAKWDLITTTGLYTRMLDRDSGHYVDVTLRASPDEIIAGYREYAMRNLETEDRFIMGPATWLNRGRWMDYE
jgi:hypothetical protein